MRQTDMYVIRFETKWILMTVDEKQTWLNLNELYLESIFFLRSSKEKLYKTKFFMDLQSVQQ